MCSAGWQGEGYSDICMALLSFLHPYLQQMLRHWTDSPRNDSDPPTCPWGFGTDVGAGIIWSGWYRLDHLIYWVTSMLMSSSFQHKFQRIWIFPDEVIFVDKISLRKAQQWDIGGVHRGRKPLKRTESLSREAACLLLLLLLSGGAAPNRLSGDYSRADSALLLQLLSSRLSVKKLSLRMKHRCGKRLQSHDICCFKSDHAEDNHEKAHNWSPSAPKERTRGSVSLCSSHLTRTFTFPQRPSSETKLQHRRITSESLKTIISESRWSCFIHQFVQDKWHSACKIQLFIWCPCVWNSGGNNSRWFGFNTEVKSHSQQKEKKKKNTRINKQMMEEWKAVFG